MIGGMPEIAASYLEHRDVGRLTRLYEGLLVSYADDAAKYARGPGQLGNLRHVIETAPLQAGERISFQGFGGSNFRSREMADALRTLERAMLLFLLYPTTAVEPPAPPDRRKSPRLLYLDTGLVNYRAGLQTGFLSPGGLGARYRRRLAEHVVGQELMAADLRTNDKPRFWVRQKAGAAAEVDYLHRYRDRLVPVEVKSGKSGALRSLHQFMQRADHDLAVRLWDGGHRPPRGEDALGAPVPAAQSALLPGAPVGRLSRLGGAGRGRRRLTRRAGAGVGMGEVPRRRVGAVTCERRPRPGVWRVRVAEGRSLRP